MTQPVDPSATKPILIIVIEDPTNKSKLSYIKTRDDLCLDKGTHLDIRGIFITKTDAEKAKKEKDRDLSGDQVHIRIPYHKWVRSENISFTGLQKKD